MLIFVTGTRGIPGIPGGIEKHCQQLYPLIAAAGHKVILATRTPYVSEKKDNWHGVALQHIFAPRRKSIEAFVHTFLAVLKARALHPDIVHINAVGPGLLIPFARLLGLRVVFTNHGPDYDRQKWGVIAKEVLRLGEWLAGKWANEVIVVSRVVAEIMRGRCGRPVNIIYNGVVLPKKSDKTDFLAQAGITRGRYILAVARLVPEKGLHDLLAAFKKLDCDYQLVIAGDADHETDYSRKLKQAAAGDERVVLTGYITGEPLRQVFSHARLFVLPSYHEGLPIALLEAMSYGLPVLVSDIPANREVDLPPERFFRCGDIPDLADKLKSLLHKEITPEEQAAYRQQIEEKYNWEKIAAQTIGVYEKVTPG